MRQKKKAAKPERQRVCYECNGRGFAATPSPTGDMLMCPTCKGVGNLPKPGGWVTIGGKPYRIVKKKEVADDKGTRTTMTLVQP
jgi:DnaJ-class molecular chaperone